MKLTQYSLIPFCACLLMSVCAQAENTSTPVDFKGIYGDEASRASVIITGGGAGIPGKVGVAQEAPETQLDIKGSFRIQDDGKQLIIGNPEVMKTLLGSETTFTPWILTGGTLGLSDSVYPIGDSVSLGSEKEGFNSLWLSPNGLTIGTSQSKATLKSTKSTLVLSINDKSAVLDDQGVIHLENIALEALKNCGSDVKGYVAKISGQGSITCGKAITDQENEQKAAEETLDNKINEAKKALESSIDAVKRISEAAKTAATDAAKAAEEAAAASSASIAVAAATEASAAAGAATGAAGAAAVSATAAALSASSATTSKEKVDELVKTIKRIDKKMTTAEVSAIKLLDEIKVQNKRLETYTVSLDLKIKRLEELVIQLASAPKSSTVVYVDPYYAPPPDCDIRLKSLSIASGRPGDTFVMYGRWGDSQGKKYAGTMYAIPHKLDIIKWSKTEITVRLPSDIPPGQHQVGVYCSNPADTFLSPANSFGLPFEVER